MQGDYTSFSRKNNRFFHCGGEIQQMAPDTAKGAAEIQRWAPSFITQQSGKILDHITILKDKCDQPLGVLFGKTRVGDDFFRRKYHLNMVASLGIRIQLFSRV